MPLRVDVDANLDRKCVIYGGNVIYVEIGFAAGPANSLLV
jgi:hypothetical protein